MNNKEAIKFWKEKSRNNPTEKTIKVNPVNDYTQVDADFILKYSTPKSTILDLASGTGLTINKYYDKVGHITAVEMFEQFSKFIIKSPKVDIINEDISNFSTDKHFDIINMFGIVSYFNESEIRTLYSKYKNYLNETGVLLIKNQFGVNENVIVNGFSEELKTDYFSEYRFVDLEVAILKEVGFKSVQVVDIYPPEANRWNDTHFYALVVKNS